MSDMSDMSDGARMCVPESVKYMCREQRARAPDLRNARVHMILIIYQARTHMLNSGAGNKGVSPEPLTSDLAHLELQQQQEQQQQEVQCLKRKRIGRQKRKPALVVLHSLHRFRKKRH